MRMERVVSGVGKALGNTSSLPKRWLLLLDFLERTLPDWSSWKARVKEPLLQKSSLAEGGGREGFL